MSILDQIEAIDSSVATQKVAQQSLNKFDDKYLFCLDYILSDYSIIDDLSQRLMNMFSTCLNIEEFFVAKYQDPYQTVTSSSSRLQTVRSWHVTVTFNYYYTSDCDALKFFNRVYQHTNLLSPEAGQRGIMQSALLAIILKRSDIDASVVIHEYTSGYGSQLYGPFAVDSEEDKKTLATLLYLLRGQESDDPKQTEYEMRRIGWLNNNNYTLRNHYRIKDGYQYEYPFEHRMIEKKEKPKWKEDLYGIKTSAYDLVVNCEKAVLKARTLRELAIRIPLMTAFIDETKIDVQPVFCESHAISLNTPNNAYSFCMNGAFYKERRRKMTANLKDMRVMNDYVQHLYDSGNIVITDDFSQLAKTITDLVNSTTLDDIRTFIRQRSTIIEHYKNIVI